MLNREKIFADFLKISEEQSKALCELLDIEKCGEDEQVWEEKLPDGKTAAHKMKLTEVKSDGDFIEFLQIIGQTKWLKGFDRTQFSHNDPKKIESKEYDKIFGQLKMLEKINYPDQTQPDLVVVLGGLESRVILRCDALKENLKSSLSPTSKKVIGLGANRILHETLEKNAIAVIQADNEKLLADFKSKQEEVLAQNKKTLDEAEFKKFETIQQQELEKFREELKKRFTEMKMVDFQVTKTLSEFKELEYISVNTQGPFTTVADPNRVKTADTARSLSDYIQQDPELSKKPKLRIAVYSDQPFVERQRRDVLAGLSLKPVMVQGVKQIYEVIGVGQALVLSSHPQSIAVSLGEVARLINIAYMQRRAAPEKKSTPEQVTNLFLSKETVKAPAMQPVNVQRLKSLC